MCQRIRAYSDRESFQRLQGPRIGGLIRQHSCDICLQRQNVDECYTISYAPSRALEKKDSIIHIGSGRFDVGVAVFVPIAAQTQLAFMTAVIFKEDFVCFRLDHGDGGGRCASDIYGCIRKQRLHHVAACLCAASCRKHARTNRIASIDVRRDCLQSDTGQRFFCFSIISGKFCFVQMITVDLNMKSTDSRL